MIGRSRRIGPALLVVATFLFAALTVPSSGAATAIDPAKCPLPSGYTQSGINDWQATGPDFYSLLCSVTDGNFTVSITVEFACPPAATDRFESTKGSNLVERSGTLSYETETGDFETNAGVFTTLEKTFLVPEPTVFITFVTYSNAAVWGSAGAIGNATIEGLATSMVNDNRPPLPGCPSSSPSPSTTPSPTTPSPTTPNSPTTSGSADPRPLLPLCDEIKNLIAGFSEERLKESGVDPNKSGIRVGQAELTQGFVDAVTDYNATHSDAQAYVSPGLPYGSAGALSWLFSEGGVYDDVSVKYVVGQEVALRDAIRAASEARTSIGQDPHLSPGAVYRLALDMTGGNASQAMLLSHNTLRSLARGGDFPYTGVNDDRSFYDKYLIKLRDGPENTGPWYHVFGIGYYQMIDDGDYGEFVTAGGLTLTTLAGGWSVSAVRILGALAGVGGGIHLGLSSTEVTNALEQLYREQFSKDPRKPDPEKYCYNVWGAAIGSLLYDQLPFKSLRGVGGPWSSFQRPAPLPPSDPSTYPQGTMINFTQSPYAVQWVQGDQAMVFDQGESLEEVGLFGTVPGWVLPIPEEEGTWAVAWGAPGDAVQEVTLEATRDDAPIEFVRMSDTTGQAAIYEMTAVAKGDRFTMTLDDSTLDPDIIGPDGEVIRPDRIVSFDIGGDIDPEAAPEPDDDNTRLLLGIGAAVIAGIALVVIVVTLVSVVRRNRRPPTFGPPPTYYPPPSW